MRNPSADPFSWIADSMTGLGTLGGTFSEARAVNATGTSSAAPRAMRSWCDSGKMSNLGPGEALGINDFGEGLSPRATCAFTSLRAATLSAEAAALPAISLGIKLDPFTPGDISYLLWLIMGYLLV